MRWMLVLGVLAGTLLGTGAFTLRYAEALSYFSSDPRACKNCHIMNDQFDGWRKASHHANATCVDCHLPQDFLGKYLAKAVNGYHHSRGFTLQDFHEPILIKERNSQILQDNCLRCHGDFVSMIVKGSTSDPNATRCVRCHAYVGHGPIR